MSTKPKLCEAPTMIGDQPKYRVCELEKGHRGPHVTTYRGERCEWNDEPNIEAQGTEARVCADIVRRQIQGVNKYGTTVAENPLSLRQWLQHAYEEAIDMAIYIKRAMEEMEKGGNGG